MTKKQNKTGDKDQTMGCRVGILGDLGWGEGAAGALGLCGVGGNNLFTGF